MLENIEVFYQSSIKINRGKVIYMDPYNISVNYNDADLIFITHSHFDHYSEDDIDKVKKKDTVIIVPYDLVTKVQNNGFLKENIVAVKQYEEHTVKEIKFETVPAYNTNKPFHPKSNNWVGYILEIDGLRYYFAGDTDNNEDIRKVKCDVAFVPVGGTYTMTSTEAAEFTNIIKPKIAVPIHYGSIVGTKQDGEQFVSLLNPEIEGKILMK